jgi:serine/threonine protein kinase
MPQPFGRYLLLDKIATGGMAEIFRAKSLGAEGFEKVVVIKRILPHYCEDDGFVTMFQDEARVAAHLNHANIVQIFDFDTVDGLQYIAMEYVEGHDLKRIFDTAVARGLLPTPQQAAFVAMEAARGLDYAHKRSKDGVSLGIVHRDVSPHNILVSNTGEVKVADFGIAKAASRSTKTRAGTIKGKCAYMSPEQARGLALDGRSDLFALGIVLWELLTGKRLFAGDSDFEILSKVLQEPIASPTQLAPHIPAELEAIVLRALARDPAERHRDAGQFAQDLARWLYATTPDLEDLHLDRYLTALFSHPPKDHKVIVTAPKAGPHPAAMGLPGPASVSARVEATLALEPAPQSPQKQPPAVNPADQPTQALPAFVLADLAAAERSAGGHSASDAAAKTTVALAAIRLPAPAHEVPAVQRVPSAGPQYFWWGLGLVSVGALATLLWAVLGRGHHPVPQGPARSVQAAMPAATIPKTTGHMAPASPLTTSVVILAVSPGSAAVQVNGQSIALAPNGTASLPSVRVGAQLQIQASAAGHETILLSRTIESGPVQTIRLELLPTQ